MRKKIAVAIIARRRCCSSTSRSKRDAFGSSHPPPPSCYTTGATIIFSSHEMHLVEQLCTRIGIMSHGKLLVEDTPEGLCRAMGVDTVEDAYIAAVGGEDAEKKTLAWFESSPA